MDFLDSDGVSGSSSSEVVSVCAPIPHDRCDQHVVSDHYPAFTLYALPTAGQKTVQIDSPVQLFALFENSKLASHCIDIGFRPTPPLIAWPNISNTPSS